MPSVPDVRLIKIGLAVLAPIARGRELGRLEVSGQGVPPMSLPLLAGADVNRLGLVPRIPAVLEHLISAR